MRLKCYYAHAKMLYDTPQEARDLELLRQELNFDVVNPNQPVHQESCRSDEWMKNGPDNEMNYFLCLVENCDLVAFRALPDMRIPAGVYREICHAKQLGKPVIELPSSTLTRGLSIELTREYYKECGYR